MANELEILTENEAGDSWVDLIPTTSIVTSYQAQNTNIEARSNGLDSVSLRVDGEALIAEAGGIVDVNGLPFVLTSVPMAFLGASIDVSPGLYKKILGACLLIAALRIVIRTDESSFTRRDLPFALAMVTGAFVGFFSGMIGIGGGIILSPLLLLTKWASMKETAAISAAFIFLNSLSGLTGHIISGMEVSPGIITWIAIAVAGGLAGSYSGSFRFTYKHLKHLVTAVLIIAVIKLYIF